MRDVDYAMSVARIRANENKLLTSQDIDRLISAKSVSEILSILLDKGYKTDESINDAFRMRINDAWKLVGDIAPDFSQFDFLIIKNDFHNFKAVLKGTVTKNNYENICISPSRVSTQIMADAIGEQRFSILPEYMNVPARRAYESFAHTRDGQLSDTILDRGALDAIESISGKLDSKFLRDLGETIVSSANIRIAIRCAKTGKSSAFLDEALCECKTLYKKELLNATLSGMDTVAEYFTKSGYGAAAKALKESISAAEKWSDNAVIEFVRKAKLDSFGPAPLAAYLVKTEAEVKTVRIIVSAKMSDISELEIRKRIRITD